MVWTEMVPGQVILIEHRRHMVDLHWCDDEYSISTAWPLHFSLGTCSAFANNMLKSQRVWHCEL